MINRSFRVRGALALMAAATAWLPAQAAELGFYVGSAYGAGSKDMDRAFFDAQAVGILNNVGFLVANATSTIETRNPSYGFVGGYRLFRHLAVEGGYVNLGKVRQSVNANGDIIGGQFAAQGPDTVALSFTSSTGGFLLSALGYYPVTYRFEVYGRAGLMFSSNELTLFLQDVQGNRSKAKVAGSSTDMMLGAGAGYSFAEIYTLRLEYQRVFDAGDGTVGKGDADVATVGITVQF